MAPMRGCLSVHSPGSAAHGTCVIALVIERVFAERVEPSDKPLDAFPSQSQRLSSSRRSLAVAMRVRGHCEAVNFTKPDRQPRNQT